MADTTVAATPARPKKVQIAIREWLDADGNVVQDGKESDVAGIRYIHLPSALKLDPKWDSESTAPPPDGAKFDYMFSDPEATNMLAAFGAHTLAGNVVNTATNGPKGDKSINPIPLIAERFRAITDDHEWADREGGVGVRFDPDLLIKAVLAAKKETDETPYRSKLALKVHATTGAVLAPDTKGAISWGRFALKNDAIKAEYNKLTGGGVSLDAI